MKKYNFTHHAVAAALVFAAGGAVAAPIAPAPVPAIDFSSQACATYGDFVSCSAQYLNYLTTGSPTGNATTDYVVQSSQGLLQSALVVFTGSQAAVSNTDIGTNIDNAYRVTAINPTVYGTMINAGEANPPGADIDPSTVVIGEVQGPVSNLTAFDIGLQALITGLTVNGVRYDPLIFFDNNQTGVTDGQNILASALVCVQDAQNVLADRCFQLVDQNGTLNPAPNGDVTGFTTSLNYGDPLTTNPVLANGTFCVSTTTKAVVAFNVASAAACPAGSIFINNNLGTNLTEFIVTIPEFNAQLEAYLAQGYDLVSIQLLFQNQNNGFEDVFILLGAPRTTTQVPEPGTLLLLGLAAIAGVGVTRYRRKS